MNDGKHTPGPWRISHNDDGLIVGDSNGISSVTIAHVMPEVRPTHAAWETLKANARLIAAAPELLGALRTMLTHGHRRCTAMTSDESKACDCGVDLAAAAIAKAEEREE